MKKALKSFGFVLVSAALLFNFSACSDDDDDKTQDPPAPATVTDEDNPAPSTTDTFDAQSIPSYALGTKLSYTDDGTTAYYEVIKNTYLSQTSAQANVVSRSATRAIKETWDDTDRYQNDEVMLAKVKEYYGFDQYIILYDTTTISENEKTDGAQLDDKYLFLDNNGTKILSYTWRWSSNYIISKQKAKELIAETGKTDGEVKLDEWKKLTVSQIREKDPERFIITNFTNDPTEKFQINISYNRNGGNDDDVEYSGDNPDGIDYSDETKIDKIYRSYYARMSNGKIASPWKTLERPNAKGKDWLEYDINQSEGLFCTFDTENTFDTRGDGAFNGYKTTSAGQYKMQIKRLTYHHADIKINKPNNGSFDTETGIEVSNEGVEVTVPNNFGKEGAFWEQGDGETGDDEGSSSSGSSSENSSSGGPSSSSGEDATESTKTVPVPKYIAVKAAGLGFSGELAPYAVIRYTNPEFDESANDIVWKTPDTDSFIKTWVEAYKTFYDNN